MKQKQQISWKIGQKQEEIIRRKMLKKERNEKEITSGGNWDKKEEILAEKRMTKWKRNVRKQ